MVSLGRHHFGCIIASYSDALFMVRLLSSNDHMCDLGYIVTSYLDALFIVRSRKLYSNPRTIIILHDLIRLSSDIDIIAWKYYWLFNFVVGYYYYSLDAAS